jgi:hypothetical protein
MRNIFPIVLHIGYSTFIKNLRLRAVLSLGSRIFFAIYHFFS